VLGETLGIGSRLAVADLQTSLGVSAEQIAHNFVVAVKVIKDRAAHPTNISSTLISMLKLQSALRSSQI
jgi:hypothetical protein